MGIMENDNGEEITVDSLARMIAKGFEGVDKQFVEVKADLTIVKRDLTDVKNRLGRVEKLEKDVQVLKDTLAIK